MLTSALALVVFAVGCQSGKTPAPAPSAAPRPAQVPAKAGPPPTPKREVHFKTGGDEELGGDLYLARDRSAPAVVLVHQLGGTRAEFAPLVKLLVRARKRFTVLAFDQRSPVAAQAGPVKEEPGERGSKDVRAAIREVLQASDQKARSVVLVGSSLGAALVSRVAFSEPKVSALALISPGAGLHGVDLYHPYAEVRNLPTFVAAASGDPISRMPLDVLSRMAMSGTAKRYAGKAHSAKLLGEAHPQLWKDLEAWLMGVFDKKPVKRQSLYYAPGKEPGAKAKRHPRVVHKRGAGGAGR